jgi:hypothetical protein
MRHALRLASNMKSREIQRSQHSQRIERSTGDAPSIGRVPRIPGTGLPKGIRRTRRRGESMRGNRERINRKRVLLAWSGLLMVIAIVVISMVIWMRVWPGSRMAETYNGPKTTPVKEERVVSEFQSPTENEALVLMKNAMTVRDPEKVGNLFRCGSAKPEDVVGFLRKIEHLDGAISDYQWLSSLDANGMLLDGVQVNFKTLRKEWRSRLAFLTPDDAGLWKVDFDSFARTVIPQWSEILENKVSQALVRVIVAPDSYFNGEFKDEEKWACYGMASPDHETILLGYCRKGSPQAKAMERILSGEDIYGNGRKIGRATLEIRRPENGDQRQFEISRVLAQDWVLSEKPFDAGDY